MTGNFTEDYDYIAEGFDCSLSNLDLLRGLTILDVRISESGGFMWLVFSERAFLRLEAYGDCCSNSYFHDINGVDVLFGGTITSLEQVSSHLDDVGDSDVGFTQFYGLKIITNKGYCDIVYRNESNGYYDGDCIFYLTTNPPDIPVRSVTTDGALTPIFYGEEG